MEHRSSFSRPRADQSESPLFSILPGEVRDRIFEYALRSYDDTSNAYSKDESYRRPGYLAPSKADRALLQTCQQVYAEAWFRPWATATHTFWLAWAGRRPDQEGLRVETMQQALNYLHQAHGDVDLSHIRVFAQLCNLERGDSLNEILQMEHFRPLRMTITIRHHDWWSWESDNDLHIASHFVDVCRLPSSLVEFRMDLESLERKKAQVDLIAQKMCQQWRFQRVDNTIMAAKEEDCEVSTWEGSSMIDQQRWIRDETTPDTLSYYIKTVVYKPAHDETKIITPSPRLSVPFGFQKRLTGRASLSQRELDAADIPPGTSADEALRMVQDLPDHDSEEESFYGSDDEIENEDEDEDDDDSNYSDHPSEDEDGD